VLQGASVLAICVGVFLLARATHPPDTARTLTFTTLVVAFLVLILANRSWERTVVRSLRTPNTALWWVVGGTALFLGVVLALPMARRLFHFGPTHGTDVALSVGAGLTCVLVFDLLKLVHKLLLPDSARPRGRGATPRRGELAAGSPPR
jgi:P-type Ca2+ transporter type 2C